MRGTAELDRLLTQVNCRITSIARLRDAGAISNRKAFAGAGLRRCLAAPDFLLDNPPQLAGLGNRSLECFC